MPSLPCPERKIRRVHAAGRRRVDLVEDLPEAQEIERQETSRGDDAPHAAAFDDEPELARWVGFILPRR
jgi:hypothetical protein